MDRDKKGRFTSEGMEGNQINKGRTPWNKGTKGIMNAWNKGKETGIVTKGCFQKGHKINEGRKYPHVIELPQNFRNRDMKGKNNPRYTGFIHPRYKIKSIEWLAIRQLILERDLFKCQDCGKTHHEVILDVHHKIPFKISGDNSPENLITLCRKCHIEEEWKIIQKLKNQKVEV